MNLPEFFLIVLKGSLFSTGGLGNLPIIHNDILQHQWASEREFAESLAVAQVSPGPNGLWIISLGYLVAGVPGVLLSLLAICIPPFLVLAIERFYRRHREHPAMVGFIRGLSLSVVGIFTMVLFGLLRNNGLDIRSIVITVVSLLLGATKRVPVIIIIFLAAIFGVICP